MSTVAIGKLQDALDMWERNPTMPVVVSVYAKRQVQEAVELLTSTNLFGACACEGCSVTEKP